MNTQLLWDGVKAMILGMGMVYFFLIIMIWIMNLTAKILKPYAGLLEKDVKAPKSNPPTTPALAAGDLAAAAFSAVRQYQNGKASGQPDSFDVPVNGQNVRVRIAPAGTANPAAPAAPGTAGGTAVEIPSPLPGTIISLAVAVNDTVNPGDVLAVIEAMKMETEIRAEAAGTVRKILVTPKQVVAAEETIMVMETTK